MKKTLRRLALGYQQKEKKHIPPEEIREENRRIRYFRILTNLTLQRLSLERMSLAEARATVEQLRTAAGRFFPGRVHVFDLVVRPRLERVINERFFPAESPSTPSPRSPDRSN
jgi:hypothetical protein